MVSSVLSGALYLECACSILGFMIFCCFNVFLSSFQWDLGLLLKGFVICHEKTLEPPMKCWFSTGLLWYIYYRLQHAHSRSGCIPSLFTLSHSYIYIKSQDFCCACACTAVYLLDCSNSCNIQSLQKTFRRAYLYPEWRQFSCRKLFIY
jgi:hypothetical protein